MKLFKTTAFAAAITLTGAGMSQAQDLRLLSGWDSSYAAVGEVLMPFIATIEDATTADIDINVMGPETVPPFEQIDPVVRGVFDMLYTNGAYHFNEIASGMTMDAMNGNTEKLREAGVWGAVDAHYQEIGLKLIAALVDLNGYHIMLKEPAGDSGLEGRRIRGTPIYHLERVDRHDRAQGRGTHDEACPGQRIMRPQYPSHRHRPPDVVERAGPEDPALSVC